MQQRLQLLDFLRGIAILCVVIDHIFAWRGLDELFFTYKQFFIFSVGPLFFLAGMTYALSYGKKLLKSPLDYLRYWWRKSSKLIFAYLVGLFIIMIWRNPSFSLLDYWRTVWTFPNQFYFISIYLQLLLIGPLLIKLWPWFQQLKLASFWLKIALPCLILLLMANFLTVLPFFGLAETWAPAKMLWGGIELWIFGLGTLVAFLYQKRKIPEVCQKPLNLVIIGSIFVFLLGLTGNFSQIFSHPPNFATVSYCASLFLIFSGSFCYLNQIKFTWLIKFFQFLGRHSLDIFIYHAFFIRELIIKTPPAWFFDNYLWQFTYLTLGACFCSILLTYLLDQVLRFASWAFESARL